MEVYDELEKAVKRLEKYDDTTILKLLREEDIKEIERKDYLLKEQGKELKDLYKEIERLNNIINELEKFMDEDYEYYEKYGYAEQGHAMGQIRRIKNKLQELKGSDKE